MQFELNERKNDAENETNGADLKANLGRPLFTVSNAVLKFETYNIGGI